VWERKKVGPEGKNTSGGSAGEGPIRKAGRSWEILTIYWRVLKNVQGIGTFDNEALKKICPAERQRNTLHQKRRKGEKGFLNHRSTKADKARWTSRKWWEKGAKAPRTRGGTLVWLNGKEGGGKRKRLWTKARCPRPSEGARGKRVS